MRNRFRSIRFPHHSLSASFTFRRFKLTPPYCSRSNGLSGVVSVEGNRMVSKNARLGLGLFVFYLAFYVAFVLVNAFAPQTMEFTVELIVGSVNLAVLSGFALIVLAVVMALLYGALCKPEDEEPATEPVADADAVQATDGEKQQ